MTMPLRGSTLRTIRRMWSGRMGMEVGDLESPGIQHLEWPGFSSTVVLHLGDAIVVAGPGPALEALRDLPEQAVLDVPTLMESLADLEPALLGAARLAYADSPSRGVPAGTPRARPGTMADVETVLARCTDAEREESGLAQMVARFLAPDASGRPAAAAGHEVWEGEVAHLGVAVAADQRGRGLGAEVASAAAFGALAAVPVLQWRSRVDNVASSRTAARLGFVELGVQIAVDLDRV